MQIERRVKDGEKTQDFVADSGIADFISNDQIINQTFSLGPRRNTEHHSFLQCKRYKAM